MRSVFKTLSNTYDRDFRENFEWFLAVKYFHKTAPSKMVIKRHLILNPFDAKVSFLYPLKNIGFLIFSGGGEMEHWREIG